MGSVDDWEYESLRLGPAEDVESVLEGYRQRGYEILHRHYVPGECYQFLMGKRRNTPRAMTG